MEYYGTPVEKFEQAILEFGVASACEYFGIMNADESVFVEEMNKDLRKKYKPAPCETKDANSAQQAAIQNGGKQ